MGTKIREFSNKLILRMLTLLGFSSTLAFMACYAPAMSDKVYDTDSLQVQVEGSDSDNIPEKASATDSWQNNQQ